MFRSLKIGTKILIVSASIAVLAIGVTGIISDLATRSALEQEAFNKLTAVREMKAQQIESYFNLISDQLSSLAHSRDVTDAMIKLGIGIKVMDPAKHDAQKEVDRLQKYYREEFSAAYRNSSGESVPFDP